MRQIIALVLLLFLSAACAFAADDNFDTQAAQASATLKMILPDCGMRMNAGDFTGANTALLETFPEKTRTAAQSFVLGNLLFETDRKLSYALHQVAAAAEPADAHVAFEWALEQHRAKQYAGALAAYQIYTKAYPQQSSPYALQADCLLHLNRLDDAIDAWRKSETAPQGSLEAMEDLVCTVNRDPMPYEQRANLLAKATRQHDADAAAELIALDCDFPDDWWNGGPRVSYLTHDLPAVISALKLPADDPRSRAITCAAACAMAEDDDADAIKKILMDNRFLIDPETTLPPHSGLFSIIVPAAVHSQAIDYAFLRKQIAPKMLELARKGHDVRVWNIAVFAGIDDAHPDATLALERAGWEATTDPRFAAGVLFIKQQNGQLKSDDPDLAAALKQFPDNGVIWRAAFEAAVRENKVTRELLASAAQAEFHHFTSFVAFATVINRPRSDYLRAYFARLLRMPPTTKPAAP